MLSQLARKYFTSSPGSSSVSEVMTVDEVLSAEVLHFDKIIKSKISKTKYMFKIYVRWSEGCWVNGGCVSVMKWCCVMDCWSSEVMLSSFLAVASNLWFTGFRELVIIERQTVFTSSTLNFSECCLLIPYTSSLIVFVRTTSWSAFHFCIISH